MPTVTVNGTAIEIEPNERLNLIQAAARADVAIPHYCWHPALSVVASCRMCLVEVGDKQSNGSVTMQPRLVPACQTPAKDGTVIVTDSPKVKQAQAATLEYLLLNHPLDCPICDQAGECYLQDYSYRYGRAESRLHEPKLTKPDKHHVGANIALFTDRCVMCSRCVRFTREISGTGELEIIHRGSHAEIDIFPGKPCDNKLAGNVVDICPVGALCSKDFLYRQRVWWLKSQESVCPDCSTGCSIAIDQNQNAIYRLRPRFNPQAQGHFMCDEGRFGFKYVMSAERLSAPMVRRSPPGSNGDGPPADWPTILAAVRNDLANVARKDPPSLVGVLSPWMTCEEAFLLAQYLKGISPGVRLALGPVPVVGADDVYPKDAFGNPRQPVQFTIRAEKCPNRRGVEAILRHFENALVEFGTIVEEAQQGKIGVLYLTGGYPGPWLDATIVEALASVSLVVLQDILRGPAVDLARYVLPGGTFAEKDGTFVNHAGLAQAIHRAVYPPGEAWPDGRILLGLLERPGLFRAPSVRAELAAAVPYFAPLAAGELGPRGLRLENREGA